jgi:integrase/recombinase XerD
MVKDIIMQQWPIPTESIGNQFPPTNTENSGGSAIQPVRNTVDIASGVLAAPNGTFLAPTLIADAGPEATERFFEFFTANIRNANTRRAYSRAVGQFFLWCSERGLGLRQIRPIVVAAYIEQLGGAKPSVKQSLAAIRMLFDWLVVGQIISTNPASAVRGPKHVMKTGKTPAVSAAQARELLDSIPGDSIVGVRDRALIAIMCFSFARVGAVVGMQVEDYFQNGKRWWIRLHEKGGKRHEVPAHHNLEAYLDSYLDSARISDERKAPLFRTIDENRSISARRMTENDVLRMVKRRARRAGLPASTCCHTFRATGITTFLENGGTIENAQAIAAHESPRTTKLYDRTGDKITLDEIERIII